MSNANTKPIRVLALLHGLDIGGHEGGAERTAIDVYKNMAQSHPEIRVHVFALWRWRTPTEEKVLADIIQAGLTVEFGQDIRGAYTVQKWLACVPVLWRICKSFQPHIIHSHASMASVCAAPLVALQPKPVFIRTAHARKEWGMGAFAALLNQIFNQFIFIGLFQFELGVSSEICRQLDGYWFNKQAKRKSILQHETIATDRIVVTSSVPPKKTDILLCVGRLSEEKGQIYLIQAIESLRTQYPNIKLFIVGNGALHDPFLRLIRTHNLEACIQLAGQTDNVAAWFQRASVFVLPSLWEGLPITLLESLAFGVPVVASNLEGIRDAVTHEHDAILVPPANVPALAQAIARVMNDGDLRERLAKNGKITAQRFTAENAAKALAQIYQQALA